MKSLKALIFLVMAVVATTILSAKEELNLFAWSEYVPQEVIDGFTKETGIKVNYETYASNEELLSKLLAGGTAYDLIQPTDYMAEAMIRAKLIQPLKLEQLPLAKNIEPALRRLPHDPEGKYTMPFMSGTVGIVINTAVVKDPIKSYKDVFQQKYKGRIVVLKDSRELVTWALYTLGLKANEIDSDTLKRVRPVLASWMPLIKLFDSDSPKTALLNGDVDIGIVWSGEAALLWKENKKFAYVLPEEGVHRFVDLLAIPAKAQNPAAAHKFINYILRPEVSRLISEKFPYTNPNIEARKLLAPEQLANPASYPKSGQLDAFRDIGRTSVLIDKLVTDLMNAQGK